MTDTFARFPFAGLKKLLKVEDTTLWDMFLVALGEVIGTAILVLVGCMGCVGSMGVTPTTVQIALTFGLAVMVAIQVQIVIHYHARARARA